MGIDKIGKFIFSEKIFYLILVFIYFGAAYQIIVPGFSLFIAKIMNWMILIFGSAVVLGLGAKTWGTKK